MSKQMSVAFVYIFMVELIYFTMYNARRAGYVAQLNLQDEIENRGRTIESLTAQKVQFESQKAKYDLATQVAHDIRSPLSALNLVSQKAVELRSDHRELFQSSILRLQEIASDLLLKNKSLTSEPQAGGATDSFHVVSILHEVVREKVIQYGDIFKILVQCPAETCLPSKYLADLKRVLANLIQNAVESYDQKAIGEVVIKLEKLPTGQIRFAICDFGKGVPPEVLPKLFAKGGTYDKPSGNGLGLSHAKDFADANGGQITIESKVNVGTIVTLTLPSK